MLFDIEYDANATWDADLSGGKLLFTEWLPNHYGVPGEFTVTGGTIEAHANLCGTGRLTFSGGTIDAAGGVSAEFGGICFLQLPPG